ncbi:hypothetical protein PMAYCL1PPCAC_27856, partial [Pristionchus mayeri]
SIPRSVLSRSSMNFFLVLSLAALVTANVRMRPGNKHFQAEHDRVVDSKLYEPGPFSCYIKEAGDTEFTVKLCGMDGSSLLSTPERRQVANYPVCMAIKTKLGYTHTCLDMPGGNELHRCSKENCLEKVLSDEVSTCCCTSSLCNGFMTPNPHQQ